MQGMFSIKKCLFSIFMVSAFIFSVPSFAWAECVSQDLAASSKTEISIEYGFTLEEAMERALACSADVITAENDLEKAKLDLREAEKGAEDLEDMMVDAGLGEPSEFEKMNNKTIYTAMVYGPAIAEKAVELRTAAYEATVAGAKIGLITQYCTVAYQEANEKSAAEALTVAQNNYDTVSLMYELGMAAKIEVMGAEVQLEAAKQSLQSAERSNQAARRDLLAMLGIDPVLGIKLETPMEYKALEEFNIDSAAAELQAKSPTVKIQQYTFDLAKIQYEYDTRFISELSYNAKVAQRTYDSAKAAYNSTKLSTKADAYNMLESLKNAEEQYLLAVESRKITAESYRLAMLRYEYGMATQNDVTAAAAELSKADAGINGALLQYNIYKTAYEHYLIMALDQK